jgi:hypothetical protein
LPKKTKLEILFEDIDTAILAINKIDIKGYGWDIESSIASAKSELIQAKGLIKRGEKK